MLYQTLLADKNKKTIALLIDPDKHTIDSLSHVAQIAERAKHVGFILFGGSIISNDIPQPIETIKKYTHKPVFLFPGSLLQLTCQADGILLLSLISGRNPELLIGNHVQAAPYLKRSGMEIIPTGYILTGQGGYTSVGYMSQTMPIPAGKTDIAVATAIAGEMLGMKTIYLEAGSGANEHVSIRTVTEVKKNVSVPLIVGGGIRTSKQANDLFGAGADVLVIGSAAEQDPEILLTL